MDHLRQASRPQHLALSRRVTATQERICWIHTLTSYFVMTDSVEQLRFTPRKRKRNVSIGDIQETDPSPRRTAKRRKRSLHSLHQTSPAFWDNLSRVPLTRRALSEYNRRVDTSIAPRPPKQETLHGDLAKQLKRFARHGGPSLRNIRGVRRTHQRYGFP